MGFSAEAPLIANIGMIRSDKGQMRLMKAAKTVLQQHPDARFVFVGQGTGDRWRERRLRQVIDQAGLENKIIMLGYRWDTPEILVAANMVVIASLCTEASPIVLREAFATGRAVVATKVGDIPEIIEHRENGLMVEPNDSDALASAILEFISDKKLAAHCAANALRYAREHFCFDRMMREKVAADLSLVRRRSALDVPPVDIASTSALPPATKPELVSAE
jgi:glycosyltransferase involved in cell wall biosynthesis